MKILLVLFFGWMIYEFRRAPFRCCVCERLIDEGSLCPECKETYGW